jgi:hypothetical protein
MDFLTLVLGLLPLAFGLWPRDFASGFTVQHLPSTIHQSLLP